LEEAVQVNDRNDPAIEFQQIFAGIPPPMRNPGWKVHRLAGLHGDFRISNDGPKCAGSHVSLFVLLEMHMKRRPTGVWWQRAFEHQDNLAIGLAHSAHPQNLSRVPVLDLQGLVHRLHLLPQ
jgi:hypothetical protein